MAYRRYGASAADFFVAIDATTKAVSAVPGATAQVWTAETAGTRVTDLLTPAGVATAVVTGDSLAGFSFQAQDNLIPPLWLDTTTNGTGKRVQVQPVDVGAKVTALTTRVTALEVAPTSSTGKEPAIARYATLADAQAAVTAGQIVDGALILVG